MKHKCKRVFKHLSVTMIKTAMKKLYYQYCNIYTANISQTCAPLSFCKKL